MNLSAKKGERRFKRKNVKKRRRERQRKKNINVSAK